MYNWKSICLTVAVVIAGAASAQTGMNTQESTTRGNIWADDTEVTRGLRVGIHKSLTDIDIEYSSDLRNQNGEAEHDLGVSIGYGVIKASQAGFMGAIAIDELSENGQGARFIRLEGGVSYGFGYGGGYGIAGLNINTIQVDGDSTIWDPAMGIQLGAGYQINPNIGFEGKYVVTRNTADIGITTVEASTSMLQMGFIATF